MQEILEAHGYKLIAMTPYPDGLRYEALWLGSKRKLVKGDVCATPEAAAESLLHACGIAS